MFLASLLTVSPSPRNKTGSRVHSLVAKRQVCGASFPSFQGAAVANIFANTDMFQTVKLESP